MANISGTNIPDIPSEDWASHLSADITDFLSSVYGPDVREGFTDIAYIIANLVLKQAVSVTDNFDNPPDSAAAQAAAVKSLFDKTISVQGLLPDGASVLEIEKNGIYLISGLRTYQDLPYESQYAGYVVSVKYVINNVKSKMIIYISKKYGIMTRFMTDNGWGGWNNVIDKLSIENDIHIVENIPNIYAAPPTNGDFTITPGAYIPAGGGDNVINQAYNIAEFSATANKIYEINMLSGSAFRNIRAVELVAGDEVKQYFVPTENAKLKRYIVGFSGTVRCSYRNTEDFEMNITDAVPLGYSQREKTFDLQYANAYVDTSGVRRSTQYDASITAPVELNAGDYIKFTAYANENLSVISETNSDGSYYLPITIGDGETRTRRDYSFCANKHMFVAVSCFGSLPTYYIAQKTDATISAPLTWWDSIGITRYGYQISVNDDLKLSYPIAVRKNDLLTFRGYFANNLAVIVRSNKILSTYMGIGSYPAIVMAPAAGINTVTYTVPEDGYICVFSKVTNVPSGFVPSLMITRKHDSQFEAEAVDAVEISKYGELTHNYVDDLDFVPNLAKKRANAILTYTADDKKNGEHIANAVAYPNGDIIACRAGGKVVRITSTGIETTLLQINNAQDWRGVFMDSNLNVYVSPHSSTFFPSISVSDRGLYRLAWGSDTFTKVIPLYENDSIPQWNSGESYVNGDIVYYLGFFYVCFNSHISSSEFEPEYWQTPAQWASNTSYSVGDIVKYNNCFFVAKTDHTSGERFNYLLWNPATAYMTNDDTIWTMCEDKDGYLYAGVYAHAVRKNPSIYRSMDGGVTWFYQHNFITNGTLPMDKYANKPTHVHCVNYNEYDGCLYAAVGEVNTICKSSNKGTTWTDMEVSCYYGQPTYLLGVKDGLLIGSDGHYSCGVSKLCTDGKTLKNCGRTAPGFIFNIRRSDLTGWLYAATRIDNLVADTSRCPPIEAVTDAAALEEWKSQAESLYLKWWSDYNEWAQKYYPEDAIRPTHAVLMVSRDEGETWEVIKYEDVCSNYASICGYITTGYFRDGECLIGCIKSIANTTNEKAFVNPIIISEGKKKRTENGYQLDGEIFIVTNESDIVPY